MTLNIDTILGRYKIEVYLGGGAFADVYRALDTLLERTVALKVLKPALVADEDAFGRFLQEARALANLQHPHIAWVWDLGSQESYYYLAVRYVDGPNLGELLKQRGRLPWDEALRLTRQVAEALDFAHGKGLAHRDVKPGNILVSPAEGAVLTDFGLVKAMQKSGLSTCTGAILGTPQYIAPEIWQGQAAGPAADQYALACVLVEMLTGEVLFDAPTPFAAVAKHAAGPELPAEWPEGAPAGLNETLARALSKEPGVRYPTAVEWVVAMSVPPVVIEPAVQNTTSAKVVETIAPTPNTQPQTSQVVEPPKNEIPAGNEKVSKLSETRDFLNRDGRSILSMVQERPQIGHVQAVHLADDPGAGGKDNSSGSEICDNQVTNPHLHSRQEGDRLWVALAEGVEMEFVRVPAGQFWMGENKEEHQVFLDEYWIGRYPVTNCQYRAFVQAAGHKVPSGWKGPRCPVGKGEHPVVYVSWHDAQSFCAWASKISGECIRLPSEAEWEKAARGADKRSYPWGEAIPDPNKCNFVRQVGDTTPVGRYSPQGDSPYGCADMAGNVWEWTNSLYKDYPYRAGDGREDPAGKDPRVLRGGSWLDYDWSSRSAFRYGSRPDSRSGDLGFRCARSPRS